MVGDDSCILKTSRPRRLEVLIFLLIFIIFSINPIGHKAFSLTCLATWRTAVDFPPQCGCNMGRLWGSTLTLVYVSNSRRQLQVISFQPLSLPVRLFLPLPFRGSRTPPGPPAAFQAWRLWPSSVDAVTKNCVRLKFRLLFPRIITIQLLSTQSSSSCHFSTGMFTRTFRSG